MNKMRLILVDANYELVEEWKIYFGDMENVTTVESDIIPIIENILRRILFLPQIRLEICKEELIWYIILTSAIN